jgi:hypothetical protein
MTETMCVEHLPRAIATFLCPCYISLSPFSPITELTLSMLLPLPFSPSRLSKLPGFLTRQHIPVSEDSHSVNVFAPGDLQEGEKLPVMVWI